MKKIILIFLFIPFVSFSQVSKKSFSKTTENYREFNLGICYFDYDDFWPGFSFLCGRTIYFNNNNTVLDFQAGLALPSIVTGKIGYGIGNVNSNLLISLRPHPGSIGLEYNTTKRRFSIEKMFGEYAAEFGNGGFLHDWLITLGFKIF